TCRIDAWAASLLAPRALPKSLSPASQRTAHREHRDKSRSSTAPSPWHHWGRGSAPLSTRRKVAYARVTEVLLLVDDGRGLRSARSAAWRACVGAPDQWRTRGPPVRSPLRLTNSSDAAPNRAPTGARMYQIRYGNLVVDDPVGMRNPTLMRVLRSAARLQELV